MTKKGKILCMLICSFCSSLVITASGYATNASQFEMTTSEPKSTGEFTVTLKGGNIEDLYAYEAKFSYDPSMLDFIKADTQIDGLSISPIVKNNGITIAHTKIGKENGEKGNIDIATLTFKPKKVGSTEVQWTSMKIIDHNLINQSFILNKSAEFTKTFSDLIGHWAQSDIMLMVNKNIVDGMDDDHFSPDINVTRAQFATLMAKGLNLKDDTTENPFSDVASGSWYEGPIKKAYTAGLINGVKETEFAPDMNITREEMSAMLMRAKAYIISTKVEDMTVNASLHFSDEGAVSDWAKRVVDLAVGSGLMNGRTDNEFAPREHASRAEAVVVLKRLLFVLSNQ